MALLFLSAVACRDGIAPAQQGQLLATVTADAANKFTPTQVTLIETGAVYFKFESVAHNVIFTTNGSPSNIANSPVNTTIIRTFPDAGIYRYECDIHPEMTGVVVVRSPTSGGGGPS